MTNATASVQEFILLGFPTAPHLHLLLFCLVLTNYLLTLSGNGVIIGITLSDHRLRSPMYFFLRNFSFVEIWFTSVTVPKLLASFLQGPQTISFAGCMIQCYFYFLLGAAEFLLLGVMSFDRYQAICNPLRYPALMTGRFCLQLVCGSWAAAFATILGPLILVTGLPYCGPNIINHFFCDRTPLVGLSCSGTQEVEAVNLVLAAVLILGSLVLTGISYGYIVLAVLRIPSLHGRRKAFSTCASHMVVVTIVYGSHIFMHVRTSHTYPEQVDKVVALMTSVVAPSLNPFIYTLRNEKVKEALWDVARRTRILATTGKAIEEMGERA
ncbi:olfactory receptor 6M1-like [Alligator sinensis]|uniref:Olfactory receptor n=1 Tax=Alligator sinensis TaxID=38654 RepID=A0A1U7SCA3_ALLSI|nr:olfactory receptor 6M1-like [Alligator sinensis]QKE59401.1 olfactory receptor 6M1-like protein [Alligator sinensis]